MSGDGNGGWRGVPAPEVLPPGPVPSGQPGVTTGPVPIYVPSAGTQPRRREGSSWATAPATYTLGGLNVVVFVAMCLMGISLTAPQPEQLLTWGADYGPAVLLGNQWWRLITAMFVHVGIIHLATNMWCLWNLGLLGEPLLGPAGMFAAYLLTGVGGNLLSTALHPGLDGDGIVGAGASGAVFGLAGVLIVLLKSKLLPLPPFEVNRLRRSVIWFAVLNFVLGAGTWVAHTSLRIDNSAHLGGFLTGLALGIPLVPRIGAPRDLFLYRRKLAIGGMALLLVLLCYGVRAFYMGAR